MIKMSEQLMAYLAGRDRQRAETVARVLARLTEREQRLVREVAVMGYVQGRRFATVTEDTVPPDSQVVYAVVEACVAMGDLYPTIAELASTEQQ